MSLSGTEQAMHQGMSPQRSTAEHPMSSASRSPERPRFSYAGPSSAAHMRMAMVWLQNTAPNSAPPASITANSPRFSMAPESLSRRPSSMPERLNIPE